MEILLKDDPVLTQAYNAYERFNADDELVTLYEAREKRLHDEATRLYVAKQEGLELGIAQGLEQGREQGRVQGLEQGREQERYATAQKLKSLGLAVDLIEQATGLTREQIENLSFKKPC